MKKLRTLLVTMARNFPLRSRYIGTPSASLKVIVPMQNRGTVEKRIEDKIITGVDYNG